MINLIHIQVYFIRI